MKILHLSDMHLPDWRIEKSAATDLRLGHEVVFAGMNSNYEGSIFSEIFHVRWTPRARRGIPFYWQAVKKQLEAVLKETRPDVVHAHNIFSAKMVSEFGIPFVYDDHEFWSRLSMLLREMGLKKESIKGESYKSASMRNVGNQLIRIRRIERIQFRSLPLD